MHARVRFLGFLVLAGLLSTLTVAGNASDEAIAAAPHDPALTTGQPVPPPRLSAGASQTLAASVAAKAMAIPTPPAGTFGINSSGTAGGGRFRDSDGGAEAWVGSGDYGIQGFGYEAGAHFKDSEESGEAYLGRGTSGIQATGTSEGGHFWDADDSGDAYVGYGDRGIEARGTDMGGYFQDEDLTAETYVAYFNYGIYAKGTDMGGFFGDSADSGYAYVAYGDRGIEAAGDEVGGFFEDYDGSGEAYVGYGERGIQASGDDMGGYFSDSDGVATGYAEVGYSDYGIRGYGNFTGGYFEDLDEGGWCRVGYGTYKVNSTGTDSFVQNHPYDPGSVIVYAAPEGDEVATYTRGTARLVDGEAVVPLGETFAWVTNPDVGLTAYVTPRGDCQGIYVASLGTEQLVVKELSGGTSDAVFDYIVYGLRIGFEELTIVQEKTQEAFIPSMHVHRARATERPEYARSTALARFTAERRALGIEQSLDLSRSQALKAAIHEFEPKVDRITAPSRDPRGRIDVATATVAAPPATTSAPSETDPTATASPLGSGIVVPQLAPESRDLVARSFSSPREQLATRVSVTGEVEAGDVLVVDREQPELLTRGAAEADPTVVGIAVTEPAVALGARGGSSADEASVAVSGIVRCKVDASYGAVQPGDLLVTSPTPGHAMRIDAPFPGTVVGKALEPLASGQDLLRVLVMLR